MTHVSDPLIFIDLPILITVKAKNKAVTELAHMLPLEQIQKGTS